MKILLDINHPAHVHFFRNSLRALRDRGHTVLLTSRKKECVELLLAELGEDHSKLSDIGGGNLYGFIKEYFVRCYRLLRYVRLHRPDVLCAVGGTFVAHVGWLARIPTIVFYDTEMATLQNRVTYPFVGRLIVPECYQGGVPRETIRYNGYHELAYLRPAYFEPNHSLAVQAGLILERKNFIVRVVSWQANHDVDQSGWSLVLLADLLDYLSARGNVIISSERELPRNIEHLRYKGTALDMHHLMSCCDLFVGESATMAAECAVLGTPAIYASAISRGYLDDIERKYKLIKVVRDFEFNNIVTAIEQILKFDAKYYYDRQVSLLSETVDVTELLMHHIEERARK